MVIKLAGLLFFFCTASHAVAAIKLIDLKTKVDGSYFSTDLIFDSAMPAKNLKPDFERNFIQLVLKGTKINSAKIVSITDKSIQKVFAYAYTPEVTRVRIILSDDSAWAKNKTTLKNINSKTVRITVRKQVEALAPHSASAAAASGVEEKKLIEEVIKNTNDIDIHNPDSVKEALSKLNDKPAEKITAATEAAAGKEETIGIKTDPSRHFVRMIVALGCVLGLFGGAVFLFKKYASKLKSLPFGKKERLIQVVATHYLGHKKSMSLVKVTGEYMVVGVSNEGISLITKLGAEVDVEKYLEDRFWGGTFEKHLEDKYDGVQDVTANLIPKIEPEKPSIRSTIRERLSGLKPLA